MGPFHWSDPQTRVALTMADDDITNNMLLSLKKNRQLAYGTSIWILPNSLFLFRVARNTNDLK
jgi:hypothetical protein